MECVCVCMYCGTTQRKFAVTLHIICGSGHAQHISIHFSALCHVHKRNSVCILIASESLPPHPSLTLPSSLSSFTLPPPPLLPPAFSETVPTAVSQPPTSSWPRLSCTEGCRSHSNPTMPSQRPCGESCLCLTTAFSAITDCHQGIGCSCNSTYYSETCLRWSLCKAATSLKQPASRPQITLKHSILLISAE